jgi:serine/threonine protein phosphatase PrpC
MTLHYKDAKGRPLARSEIKLTQTDTCEAYGAYEDCLQIGWFEAKGERTYQEDRIALGTLPIEGLSTAEKVAGMVASFKKLHATYAPRYPATGCTALATLITDQSLTTIWLGDSQAFLLLYGDKNQLVSFKPLNLTLHHPDEGTVEGQRATQIADQFHVPRPYESFPGLWRLGNGLALSRAIGDLASEPFGLSHEPDFSEVTYQLPTLGYGYLITACDGLTEAMSLSDIENFVATLTVREPLAIAQQLVDRALNRQEPDMTKRSFDNVSVIVSQLNVTLPTRVVALFDGHNGSQLAEALSQNFVTTLLAILKQ